MGAENVLVTSPPNTQCRARPRKGPRGRLLNELVAQGIQTRCGTKARVAFGYSAQRARPQQAQRLHRLSRPPVQPPLPAPGRLPSHAERTVQNIHLYHLVFQNKVQKTDATSEGPAGICQETAEQILLLRKMLLLPVCPGDRPHCLPLGCNELRGPSAQATLTGVPGTNPRIQTDDGSSSHWEPPQPTLGAPSGCSTGPTHGLRSVTLLLAMTPNGWGAL